MAVGAESPSQAFLAGQAHGASLAAKPKPKAAAPTTKKPQRTPARTQTSSDVARRTAGPGGFDIAALLRQAQALAQAQTEAQIKAIRDQQGVYTSQAQDRAGQINLAAQAAAKFLAGLGDQTSTSYQTAAKTLGGLATGFSGVARDDATAAADEVQANLAGLGAPAGSAKTSTGQTSSPEGLSNVLYGLGGYLPGNLLLTSGEAAAAAARQLPASALGYGQQQAAGTLFQGSQQADTLTPQILAARAKQPDLARSILGDLEDSIYKQAQLGQAQTRLEQGQQRIDLASQIADFNAQYKIASYNLSKERLNLSARQFAQQVLQSDRSYAVSLAGLGIRQAKEQRQAAIDEYKLSNGGFTPAQVNKYTGAAINIADQAFQGIPKIDKNGQVVTRNGKTVYEFPPINYKQAIREGRKEGIPLSLLIPELDKVYKPGRRGRPLVDNGSSSFNFASSEVLTGADPFGGKTGRVLVAPGADRRGVAVSPTVKQFVAKVAGIYGEPLTIGTGTNHNQFVKGSSRVSDHWDGNAADIPAYGSKLTRLGQDALIAAGADPSWARQQKGGLFNLNTRAGRVQVIFNTLEGGNHYNHLHVGVR